MPVVIVAIVNNPGPNRLESPVKDLDHDPPPSPSAQTPLIVIEEWVTVEDGETSTERSMETREERVVEEELKMRAAEEERGKHRKARRTPSPLLSDVREESEEEIKKYEDDDTAREMYVPGP